MVHSNLKVSHSKKCQKKITKFNFKIIPTNLCGTFEIKVSMKILCTTLTPNKIRLNHVCIMKWYEIVATQ